MKIKTLFFIIMLCYSVSYAQTGLSSGFEFLNTDFSPRTSAMGTAFITMRGDLNGISVNPAGLAYIKDRQFFFNYSDYLLDINGGQAGYSTEVPYLKRVGLAITYMDYGQFDETDQYAVSTGKTFSAYDFALTLSQAGDLDPHFSYGVSAKYVYSKIERYSASALALDFGLIYAAPFEQDLYFAATLLNVGWNISYYDKIREPLPTSFNIGFSKKLAHLPLEVSLNLQNLNQRADRWYDRLKRFSAGGEFSLSRYLHLRIGYSNAQHQSLQINSASQSSFGGVSGGLSIFWKEFRIDYSYSNFSDLGNVHRFGFSGSIH